MSIVNTAHKPNFGDVNLTDAEIDRFWQKVDKSSACWVWMGARNARGYGHFKLRKRVQVAHRVAWVISHGSISDGLVVCHKCDTPSCVNPDHLFIGTQADNVRDMVSKKRGVNLSGERHWNAKLSDLQVVEIRERYAQGDTTYQELAHEYQVTSEEIGKVIRLKSRVGGSR